ncbi:cytochrome c3 family protein [Adlercreutzia mucosicola]|uniref:cytochrome c3 family protein n=1 Tax=Adlercreutzia mucosicola TaxID=580026 RepID=UPI0003FEF6E0|nr:cytochrome c3 family protein [Adlercreutzia mucosicola]MCI9495492.1 cytochrome c3 family protein [Adlercreutzia mucosicola]
MKKNALKLVAAACALTVGVALFACAPQQPATDADQAAGGTAEEQVDATAEAGQYQSDEQCLSCHGGSYEALAETTADYGLSNPHNSIHGGYNSCVNCHARDKEVTDNQCDNCHAWPHNPTNGPGASL